MREHLHDGWARRGFEGQPSTMVTPKALGCASWSGVRRTRFRERGAGTGDWKDERADVLPHGRAG